MTFEWDFFSDDRQDYGENRQIGFGMVVVFTALPGLFQIPEIGDGFFAKAALVWPPEKKQLSMRLDIDRD